MRYRFFAVLFALLLVRTAVRAQSSVPIVSGGGGFISTTDGGSTFFRPVVAPVVAVPLGDRWLIESRIDLRGFFDQPSGSSGYQGHFFDTIEYAQIDYNAASWLTIVGGRFLTPFNMYNERFTPIWIRNFQDAPIVFAIGTRTTGYSDGMMARGALVSRKNYEVNYTAYFSTLSTITKLESGRAAGARLGVFIPPTRMELGVSYQRLLQDQRMNSLGAYLSWQPPDVPMTVRGEYAHSPLGQGFWAEGSYRFSRFRGPDSLLGRFEVLGRAQQFIHGVPDPTGALPTTNTQRAEFGWNYYLPHEVRLNASYGRQFTPIGNSNVWNFAVTYRFLFPLFPGRQQ